jgi:hypothetical protein
MPQRQHVTVTVDDAGFRRMHRGDAGEPRLETLGGRGVDELDPFHAVGLRLLVERCEPLDLARVGGDDELAALAMRHAVRGAEIVEHASAARAVVGAQRARRVIKAGVNDLAVARGNPGAHGGGRFRHHHVVSGQRGRARDRESDDARSDHEHLHPLRPAHSSTGRPA